METNQLKRITLLSLSVFLGLTLLGYFIFKGLKTFSDKDRVVTVKGLAEMNMSANSSVVTISFSFSGDDLQGVINQTEQKKRMIHTFLKNNGYAEKSIQFSNLSVTDNQKYYENRWEDGKEVQVKIDRYVISQYIEMTVDDVKSTENIASEITLALIQKDLTSTLATNYTFPELNSIKPKLIAASTKNARLSGEQFANDSQAQLGKIKTASQGQISIAGEYSYGEDSEGSNNAPQEPYIQKARVVSTIVFFLE
ncbi:MAG: SIMPL domain-containing protein [Crocinitomicaceae bacterium]|nr:SIMPL domain-containing protein [Crocinitomicaceae bacterium]